VINLRTFFRWTGIALIFIAAGLLSHAVHEFVEIGWINVGTATAFDVSGVLPHEAADGAPGGLVLFIGQLLRAMFGYTSQPEVITVVTWLAYVVVVLTLYLRPTSPRPAPVARAWRQRGMSAPVRARGGSASSEPDRSVR
jgi:high-affinity iron transporter